MLLSELIKENNEQLRHLYTLWQRACRLHFPNCTFTGSPQQAQAVDWSSKNNEVAGDWEGNRGVVYKPGTLGKQVAETIGDPQ